MALVFVSPPNSYFEMLTPSNDGIRTWGLGGGGSWVMREEPS